MNDSLEELRAKARQQVAERHAKEVRLGTEVANAASMALRYTSDIDGYLTLVLNRLAEDNIGPTGTMAGTDYPTGTELNYPMEKLRAAASSAQWLASMLRDEVIRIEVERNV